VVTVALVANLFGDVLNIEGLLGGDPEDIILGEPAVGTAHPLAGEPQPGPSPGVAVVHDKLALLVLDLCVVGGYALVGESDVRLLGLADAHCVVVFEDGAVGWFVFGFFELELYDPFVHVLG